jgi:hypothetical membrane protein
VKRISGWALESAAAAPILLVGGWTIAAALQPAGYDPIRDTISALAAHGATDRWVMTAALVGVGTSYLVTATGLPAARRAGRWVLAGGGAATIAVALFPQPAHGGSVAHTIAASVAFISLAAWPVVAARRDSPAPLLRRPVGAAATLALLGLVAWFAMELHGGQRGLSERAAAGAQALWPLLVVATTRAFSSAANLDDMPAAAAEW